MEKSLTTICYVQGVVLSLLCTPHLFNNQNHSLEQVVTILWMRRWRLGNLTCPGWHSWKVTLCGFKHRSLWFQILCPFFILLQRKNMFTIGTLSNLDKKSHVIKLSKNNHCQVITLYTSFLFWMHILCPLTLRGKIRSEKCCLYNTCRFLCLEQFHLRL